MTEEQCQTYFDYISSRKDELNSFDATSLLKCMADIPNFKREHLEQVLAWSLERLDDLQLKELNHIMLAYFTKPSLLDQAQVKQILAKI